MLITEEMPQSISAEAYRTLRTKIKYYSIDKPIKSIVITAAEKSEGKSTVSGNLAFSLSQDGEKVMIIDCDLRKPSLHKKFDVDNTKGLTDYLINKYSLNEVTKKISNKLSLITSGPIPPNPAEVLGSNKLYNLIEELAGTYDYILIDTPPIRAVADAEILAAKSDATLIVVRAGKTKSKSIYTAYTELIKVKANVIGTILNEADSDSNMSYHNYHIEKDRGRLKKLISKK